MPVNITVLTEMCVGVTASSMPAVAKFVQHQFPGFSVIDSVLSWKSFLLSTGRSKTKDPPSDSGSQDHIIGQPSLGTHFGMTNIGLGNVSLITACDEDNVAKTMENTGGIRIDRAWEHASLKTEKCPV
ncbi:MAG: hypothetical protein Q9172_000354 [Xanthocarpia lactea]